MEALVGRCNLTAYTFTSLHRRKDRSRYKPHISRGIKDQIVGILYQIQGYHIMRLDKHG